MSEIRVPGASPARARLRTPWRAVAASFALNGILLGVWASRIPAVVDHHGLGRAQLGVLLLCMGIGALISFPLAGRLSDSRGAVSVTRWLAAGYPLALILIALAPSPVWLGAALFVFGAMHGAMDVTMNSWAGEVEKRIGHSVMSSFHAMWSLGAGLGAASGFAAASLSLAVPVHFIAAAVLGALLLGPFLTLPWKSQTSAHSHDGPVFAFPRGALIAVGLITMASGLGEGSVADWSAIYLKDIVGVGEAHATLGYAVFSVTMVAMRLVADRLITRFGPVVVARLSGISAAVGLAIVVLVPAFVPALLGYVLMGLGYAAVVPLAYSRAAADPLIPPGRGIASVATLGYGSLLMGPPAIGFVAEVTSLRFAFAILAVAALMITALAPVLSRAGGRAGGALPQAD
ncbi:MFS transporter [Tropicimonas sp. IMCC34043]|uniref:MFS transporter n=1 Tax=Tropicimonas sp. IMCC34043 TaxID=2248760 RepID=UPI000E23A262|nr:MFS transporter [Tropicimonas sp. IMCC34043]